MTSSKKLIAAGEKLAEALEGVIQNAKEGTDDPVVCEDLEALVWDWHIQHSYLLKIMVEMCELGYSISIDAAHDHDPEDTYVLSDFDGPRECAIAAHSWHNQMDIIDFYFYKENDTEQQDWLLWVPCNDRGEQLGDYIAGRDIDKIVERIGSEYEE